MPPKKKAKLKSPVPNDPQDYVAYVRETSRERFDTSSNHNHHRRRSSNSDTIPIEQNVREIRALLKINAEIFSRVMGSASNYIDGKSASFTRYGFDFVKVRQQDNDSGRYGSSSNNTSTMIQFITEYERNEQTFDMKPLSTLPDDLNDVFALKHQVYPFDIFINFEAFFGSALMLHDDIMERFLTKLKSHIESIHVCLGGIEAWLVESNANIVFLEESFGTNLEIPNADDFLGQECACGPLTHMHSDLCLDCNREYGSHYPQSLGVGAAKLRCLSGHREAFKCKKIHILKSFKESGKFEKTFNIGKENDQIKLKKFLEFMES